MLKGSLAIIVVSLWTPLAFAQGANPGSATMGGGGDCTETIAGQSIDDMIASAGGIERLHELTVAQLREYDQWMSQMEKVMNQGVREKEIKDAYEQGVAARASNVELKDALECRMGM